MEKLYNNWVNFYTQVRMLIQMISSNANKDASPSPCLLSEKIECKSCHKEFRKASILRHIGHTSKCKKDYNESPELELLRKMALERKTGTFVKL